MDKNSNLKPDGHMRVYMLAVADTPHCRLVLLLGYLFLVLNVIAELFHMRLRDVCRVSLILANVVLSFQNLTLCHSSQTVHL